MPQECTNEKIGRLITLYELDQLSEKDRRRFEEHLLECRVCLQELQEMKPLISVLRDERAEILKHLSAEGIGFSEQKRLWEEIQKEGAAKSEVITLSTRLGQWLKKVLRTRIWIPVAVTAVAAVVLLSLIPPTHLFAPSIVMSPVGFWMRAIFAMATLLLFATAAVLYLLLSRPRSPYRSHMATAKRPVFFFAVVWVPAAAAAAVLLLIFFLPLSRTHNPYLPYLDYSKAPYSRIAFRGPAGQINEEAKEAFDAGMAEYQKDNFRLAIKQIQKAVRLAPEDSEYWLYLGISEYLARHPQPAIEALNRALSAANESMREKANWYLAQAYLLNNEPERALPLMEEIIRQGGDFSVRADSLSGKVLWIK